MTEMFRYHFDKTDWPVVHVASPRDIDLALVDSDSFYEAFDSFLRRRERAFILHDLRGMPRLDAERRRRFAQFGKDRAPEIGDMVAGYAALVDTSFMNGAITAVLWLLRPPSPIKVLSDPVDALAWFESIDPDLYATRRFSMRA